MAGFTLMPEALRGYDRSWLSADVIAGVTLAAIAIPEVMGYTSIAQTPIQTGLYTIMIPTVLFALLGSSRLLVVGADSATAAVLAAGIAALGISGLSPNTSEWVAWCSLTALVAGALLVLARLFKLGFIGDFLSASVLIGFLTGVGIQVFSGQIPDMLGVPKGTGNWFAQQWHTITEIPNAQGAAVMYSAITLGLIYGAKRFAPKVPGALVAVLLTIAISTALDSAGKGIAVVGAVPSGFPPLGLPTGLEAGDIVKILPTAVACVVLIIAQSAATSRSFAARHGERVDVNRDLVGLSAASFGAGLSGTFVVNGSPTKTQILDEQKGRTQVANLVMAGIVTLFALFFTGLLQNMPKATLGAIVFAIGVSLIDLKGLKRVGAANRSDFLIAALTCVTVFAIGVEQGVILAVVLSILALVQRQYRARAFVIGVDQDGARSYQPAGPGTQSAPGLVVFAYTAELFYANAQRFADDVESVVDAAPDPVRWLVLDAAAIEDVDYSAGIAVGNVIDFVHSRDAVFVLAAATPTVMDRLAAYGVADRIPAEHRFDSVGAAVTAFQQLPAVPAS